MTAETGFLKCGTITCVSCRLSAAIGCGRPAPRCDSQPGSASAWQWRSLDAVGLSWTSRDMIQKARRADRARSEATDAGRTERGFHAVGNGETAGQWPFRWVGMRGL